MRFLPTPATSIISEERKRDAFIDPLRIIAFSSVLIGHLYSKTFENFANSPNPNTSFIGKMLVPFWSGGGFGVVLFFLVSGYAITKSSLLESPKTFLIRRFFRIYPSLTLAIIIFTLLNIITGTNNFQLSQILTGITLFGDFFSTPNQLAGVDWTLRIEVLFYLTVFGFMLLKSKVHRQMNRKSPIKKKAHIILLTCILIFSIIPIFPNYPGTSFTGYLSLFFPIFLYGSAAAFHEQEKISSMSLVVYGVTSIFLVLNGIELYRPDLYWVGPFVTYGFLLFTVAYIWRNNFKTNIYVAWIAGLTYSVYLFHKWLIPYIETFVVFLVKKTPLSSVELNLYNSIPVVNLLSVLLFFMIINIYVMNVEVPIIRWSKKISGPR